MAAWNSFSAGVGVGTVIWVRSMESSVVNDSRVVDVVVDVVVVRGGVEFFLANDDDVDGGDSTENLNDDNLGDMKVVCGRSGGFGNDDVVRALHLLIHRVVVVVDRNAKRNIALSKDVAMFVVACSYTSTR